MVQDPCVGACMKQYNNHGKNESQKPDQWILSHRFLFSPQLLKCTNRKTERFSLKQYAYSKNHSTGFFVLSGNRPYSSPAFPSEKSMMNIHSHQIEAVKPRIIYIVRSPSVLMEGISGAGDPEHDLPFAYPPASITSSTRAALAISIILSRFLQPLWRSEKNRKVKSTSWRAQSISSISSGLSLVKNRSHGFVLPKRSLWKERIWPAQPGRLWSVCASVSLSSP